MPMCLSCLHQDLLLCKLISGLQCCGKAPVSAHVQRCLANTAVSGFTWRPASLLLLSHSRLCDAHAASCVIVLKNICLSKKIVSPNTDSGNAQAE